MDALVLTVFLITFTAVAGYLLRRAWRSWCLIRRGIRTTGRVLYVREDTDGDGDPKYIPVITFRRADGTECEAEPADGTPNSRLLFPGQTWKIRHHPAWPSKIYIEHYDSPEMEIVLGLVALLFPVAAATILGRLLL
ncbi:DUF3592 domain-containing protein [Streptomyces xantholiticus]